MGVKWGGANSFCGLVRPKSRLGSGDLLKLWETRWSAYAEVHFYSLLVGLTLIYFGFALLAKYSQYRSLALHGQDFWLFVDLLEQLKKGGVFLTRFAPQSLGFVQHGSVHPMFSWAALLPLVWIFGSITTALIFNPLMLAAAAWMIGVLAYRRAGSRPDHHRSNHRFNPRSNQRSNHHRGGATALLLAAAFLASTQVGKVLMYDVHPEAAYPFLTLLVLWALGLDGSKRVRWKTLVVSTLLCAGIKEDSFLILLPWVAWALWTFRAPTRHRQSTQFYAALVCGILVVGVALLQMFAVNQWSNGAWGPKIWEGQSVIRAAGSVSSTAFIGPDSPRLAKYSRTS